MKDQKSMPLWARAVAAVAGIVLLPGGLIVLCVVRPLDWLILSAIIGAVISGGAFAFAAVSGEWPLDI